MVELIAPVPLLALALGFSHAFEADHVAAVSSLVTRARSVRASTLLGVAWGMGHTTTLVVVGLVLLALRLQVNELWSMRLEGVVGIALIVLGLNTLWVARVRPVHFHVHDHGDAPHAHFHSHTASLRHNHTHVSFLVGLIHGLAGSGALALLAVASVSTFFVGVFFLLLFGFGSLLGMAFLASSMGYLMSKTKRFEALHRSIQYISGALCLLVALTLLPF